MSSSNRFIIFYDMRDLLDILLGFFAVSEERIFYLLSWVSFVFLLHVEDD